MARYLCIAASSQMAQCLIKLLKDKGDEVFTSARDSSKIIPDAECDASDFEAVNELFKKAGDIDGVVNFSGSLLLKSAHLTKQKEYDAVIAASLTSAFATTHAAGRHMRQGGSVVLISSAAAMVGLVNHEAIAAAKAGIIGLAQSAAATYAANNLRFNVVAPGMTNTALTSSLMENKTAFEVSKSMHALGRIGKPEDIASAVAFFLDPKNDWITGQVLAVDGGLSRVRPKAKI